MRLILLILIFLFFGAFFIISNNNLALSGGGNFNKFLKGYKDWLRDVGDNFVGVVGYAIKMEWVPER